MLLSLNTFGDVPQWVPWDEFVAGFEPLQVRQGHFADEWLLEHPTFPLVLLSSTKDNLTSFAQLQSEYLARLGADPSCFDHPVWTGIFKAFTSWPAVLTLESPTFTNALFVSRDDLMQQLPWWVDRHELRYVVPDRAEFDSLIAEAFALDRAYWTTRGRIGWADEIEQDAEALEAFCNFIDGKKEKTQTYTLGGKPVKSYYSMSGSFLDLYGDNIDWRQGDDEIVECFGLRLKNPRLELGPSNDALEILFGSRSRTLTMREIGKERYQTVRALNELLAPSFQIRVVRESVHSDTHCFLYAPTWLWTELEMRDRKKLERKVKVIGPRDGFH